MRAPRPPRSIASAAAALLAVAAASAARADASAAVAVRATPATLVLGADERAALEIDAGGDAPPAVRASVGRIENLRSVGAGRFAADYLAPAEAYPQVAIVAVLAGARCGFTSIPLVGRGVAVARSVPRSPIRVTIGTTSFGPVVADAGGEAQVPVVVPPGVRFAYHRGKPLDLGIPPTPHVEVLVGRTDAAADASHEVPICAFAVTPEGAPRPGAPVELAVTEGRVERLAEVGPGAFAGTWRVDPGRAGAATATVRIADDPAPPRAGTLPRPAGQAARVVVESRTARLTAGDDAALRVRVTVSDAAGNPVADVPRLHATFGTIADPVAAGPGAWEAAFSSPAALGPVRSADVIARVGSVEDRLRVVLSPAAPARLSLSPGAGTLVADGGSEARVRVQVVDRFGNDVPVAAPEVKVTRGGHVSAEPDAGGGWAVRYRPARARAADAEVLSVSAGPVAGSARFELLAPERRISIAPILGFAASRSGVRSPLLGAQGTWWTALLDGRVGLRADVATFVHERTDPVATGGGSLSVHGRARYVPVLASLLWRERLGGTQEAWAAAGAGLAFVSSTVSASGGTSQDERGLAGALQASAGWGRRIGRGVPFAEVRLGWTSDAGLDALRGSLAVLTLSVGYGHDAL